MKRFNFGLLMLFLLGFHSSQICFAQDSSETLEKLCNEANAYTQKYLDGGKQEKKWVLLALKKGLDARKLDKTSALPHVAMGKAFRAQGKRNKARQRAVSAVLLDESNLDARRLLEDLEYDNTNGNDKAHSFNFQNGLDRGWKDDGSGCWSVVGGVYSMLGNKGNTGRFTLFETDYSDFVLQADVRKTVGEGTDQVYGYGVYFRSDQRGSNFYEFIIVRDGRYQVGQATNGHFSKIIKWPIAKELKTGFGAWNTLKVVAEGDVLRFYANGKLLNVVRDSSHSLGRVGLMAIDAGTSSPADTVEFDNVSFSSLPQDKE